MLYTSGLPVLAAALTAAPASELLSIRNIYLFLAITGSVFLLIQFLFSVFGGGDAGECDCGCGGTDGAEGADISGLNFVSLKTITGFVTFFGWGGVFWGDCGGRLTGMAIAVVCGLVMALLTAFIISMLLKLQQSGNISPADYVGKNGVVYLGMKGGRKEYGVASIDLASCTREIRCVADEELKQGDPVTVAEMISSELFLVKKSE